MVRLTEKAKKRVKAQLEKEGRPGGCLRMRVDAGGCSGMSYSFVFADAPLETDEVQAQDGVRLAVQMSAVLFVRGSTVDWYETLMEAGFRVQNPNATAFCSCGTSFSTDEFPTDTGKCSQKSPAFS